MLHEHQSYEDFQLDALIQYDLTDDEDNTCSRSKNELISLSSDGMDEVAFHTFYESTPCMVYDVDEPIPPISRGLKKRIFMRIRQVKEGKSTANKQFSAEGTHGTIRRRHSIGARPEEQNQTISQRDSIFRVFQMFQRPKVKRTRTKNDRWGVERGKSVRTQETAVFDESINDNLLEVNIKKSMNDSLSSICYLVDDDLSEVLADQCVEILNDSVSAITNGKYDDDSVSTITNGHCDNLLSELESMVNHSKHNRSMPIIDTKSMEFLTEGKESPLRKPRGRSMSNYPYIKIDL
jgi:hypothetical protein